MADALITSDDLLLALDGGTEQLRRLCGQEGDGSPRADRLAYGIAVASEEAYGLLLAGFPDVAQVQALAAADISIRHAVAMLFREKLAEGKDEFRLGDGSTVFSVDGRRARDLLRSKASNATRSSAEEVPGVGPSAMNRPRSSSLGCAPVITERNGRPVGF